MSGADSSWFLLAAYGATLVLLAAEVAQLAGRCRRRAPRLHPGRRDET
jgi:hypothetical protein